MEKQSKTMVIECCKLKTDPLIPWSFLEVAVPEKNAFGLPDD